MTNERVIIDDTGRLLQADLLHACEEVPRLPHVPLEPDSCFKRWMCLQGLFYFKDSRRLITSG